MTNTTAKLTVKVKLYQEPLSELLAEDSGEQRDHNRQEWLVGKIVMASSVLLLCLVGIGYGLFYSSEKQQVSLALQAPAELSETTKGVLNAVASRTESGQSNIEVKAEANSEPVTQAVEPSPQLATDAILAKAAVPVSQAPASTKPELKTLPTGFERIVLTAQMERLEPGTALATVIDRQQIERLYLFTELRGYAGQQLRHRWWYKQQLQTETVLTIEDSPWRTYSEKWLLADQLGHWRVEIVDQQQNVLYQHDFHYQ